MHRDRKRILIFPAFRLRIAAAALAAMFAVGCAAHAPVVNNPKYQGSVLDGRVLLVLPWTDVQVKDPEDFRERFKGEGASKASLPGPFLARIFNRKLSELADHMTLAFDSASGDKEIEWQDVILKVPGKDGLADAEFPSIPAAAFKDGTPDLSLQLSHLSFEYSEHGSAGFAMPMQVATPAGSMAAGGMMAAGGGGRSLGLEGTYIIWDHRSREAVAYGRFECVSGAGIMGSEWDDVLADAAVFIVKHSPLRGGKYEKSVRDHDAAVKMRAGY